MPVRSSESNVTGVADALLLRAQSGDRAAFEGLMVLHERRVYATARHVLGHAEDAEDALQEVFLRLYRSLGRIEAGKSLAAWLYRVTVNVCCSLLRKRRRYRGAASIDELGHLQLTATEAAPEETLAQRQELVIVQRAIAELPRKERIAIVLRDMEGLSTGEVAEILGSSQTTVRSQICRARLRIRAHLQQYTEGKVR
jgi:RNA polymerase sigma-70 factor (ECF subfamily)